MNADVRDTSADSHLSCQKPCTEAKMMKDLMRIQISAMMSSVASERMLRALVHLKLLEILL